MAVESEKGAPQQPTEQTTEQPSAPEPAVEATGETPSGQQPQQTQQKPASQQPADDTSVSDDTSQQDDSDDNTPTITLPEEELALREEAKGSIVESKTWLASLWLRWLERAVFKGWRIFGRGGGKAQ